jgi:hypothetical protein
MMLEDKQILNANTTEENLTKSKSPFIKNNFSHFRDFLYMDFYKEQNTFKMKNHSRFRI